jgi:hypothetical protein
VCVCVRGCVRDCGSVRYLQERDTFFGHLLHLTPQSGPVATFIRRRTWTPPSTSHSAQCVCVRCVCVRSSTIVRLCVCSVWCRGVCRVTCRYVHPPAAGTHRKKPKMGNRLSSCGPLIRKAYRHEDTPWQNSRKRDGHLLRYRV